MLRHFVIIISLILPIMFTAAVVAQHARTLYIQEEPGSILMPMLDSLMLGKPIMCCVGIIRLLWVIVLPSVCREDVFVAVIPMPLHHFPCCNSNVALMSVRCGNNRINSTSAAPPPSLHVSQSSPCWHHSPRECPPSHQNQTGGLTSLLPLS